MLLLRIIVKIDHHPPVNCKIKGYVVADIVVAGPPYNLILIPQMLGLGPSNVNAYFTLGFVV
jgi:hypothetical protein